MLKKGFSVEVILATHARSPQASVELQNFILYIRGTELRELFKTNAQEIVDKFPDLAPPSDELCTAMEPYLKVLFSVRIQRIMFNFSISVVHTAIFRYCSKKNSRLMPLPLILNRFRPGYMSFIARKLFIIV